jgi:hypothetical protein
MIKLSNVAGPGMFAQCFDGLWCEPGYRPPVTRTMLAEEVFRKRGNVFTPIAKWGKMDLDRVQAEQEVTSNSSLFDF